MSGSPKDEELVALLGLLKPGAKAVFSSVVEESRLLLAGFVDTIGNCAARPDWEDGAVQSLKKEQGRWKLDEEDLVEDEFRPWQSGQVQGELMDETDLLRDIAEVEPGSLVLAPDAGECGPAKKACKNCVCGRAELEASGAAQSKAKTLAESGAVERDASGRAVVDTAKLKAAAGGCGSCSLGDAFRCAGCPSKGLPAYSVGDKIVLDL